MVKPMFLHWCLPKTLVKPMFLHWCLHKTLVFTNVFLPEEQKNIGKTNKNHKNQDLQTLGWRLQILVWQGARRKTLVKPMFQLTETHKKVGTWGGGHHIYIYICIIGLYTHREPIQGSKSQSLSPIPMEAHKGFAI